MRHAVAQSETQDTPLDQARAGLAEIAKDLQETLTQRLVAYVVGLSDGRDIGRYVRRERTPHPSTAGKLRDLYYVVNLLRAQEDNQTIQAWFTGMNPELDDRSPATLLRESFEENKTRVVTAARKFLSAG